MTQPTLLSVPAEVSGAGRYIPTPPAIAVPQKTLFAQGGQVGGYSVKQVTLPVPALAAGGSTTVTGTVALTGGTLPAGISLQAGQTAALLTTVVLLASPVGIIASHAVLTTEGGLFLVGPYSGGIPAGTLTFTVYAPAATTSGVLVAQVTTLLAGNV